MSRVLLALAALALIAGGPMEPEIPNCDSIQNDAEYEACVAYVAELLMEQMQEQEQMPEQFALPNQPTTVVIDQGGSSIGEWAALFSGLAGLLAALEVLRRRRKHGPL